MRGIGITRWAAVAVAGIGLFATTLLGQPPRTPPADPLLDAAKAQRKIADQKAESEVLGAIQEADRLLKTNPAKALQRLKGAQSDIDLSVAISGDARKGLTAMLQGKIAAIEGKPNPNGGGKLDPAGPAVKLTKEAAFEAYRAEVKEVGEGIDAVQKLRTAGRLTEADQVVAGLAKKYPDNPAILWMTQKDNVNRQLADARAFTTLQSDRVNIAFKAVDKSSIPAGRDVEFPADWKERTKNRTNGTEVELTAKEKSIISALDKAVTVSFNDRPLDECLQDLSNLMDQSLFIDQKSLTDLGIDLKKPVRVDAKGISARTVLRQILGAQGLTFVVKGEAIQVMTVERARDQLVTRVYYLGDVVQGVGPFGGALQWGTFLDFQQTMANVQVIMDAIQESIDPMSWKAKGGPCTITFHYPSMSIVVRASSEVHASLGSKLGSRK